MRELPNAKSMEQARVLPYIRHHPEGCRGQVVRSCTGRPEQPLSSKERLTRSRCPEAYK